MTVIPVLLVMILLMLVCLAIPILLGVFVYRDAKSRGMEALLWALIAVLAPSFIGLIIYLLVRKDHILLNCPNCGGEVQEYFTTCPSCGQKLKAGCPNCGTALKPEWKICPQCGREVTETENFTPPVVDKGKKSKGLVGIIIAIVAVPLIIILLVLFGALGYLGVNSAVETVDGYNTTEVMDAFNSAVEITDMEIITMEDADSALADVDKAWIAECQKGEDGIYSKTIYEFESGGFQSASTFDKNSVVGDYELIYAYTIIVVNSPDGKACNYPNKENTSGELGHTSYEVNGTMGQIPENMEFTLEEVEDYDKYNNVFIVKSLYDYNISLKRDTQTQEYVGDTMESDALMVTIFDETSRIDYKIPIQEEPAYVAFSK